MSSKTAVDIRGKWALVTGASSGIGQALAQQLASCGAHLVLTARRIDRLNLLAEELRAKHDVQVETFQMDLTDPGAPDSLYTFTAERDLPIDVLVNNAGVGHYGEFCKSDVNEQLAMIQLHCSAVLHITHRYLQAMIDRRSGYILIVATTSLIPAPYLTTYAATKGFDLLFAEGLAEEVAHYGVRVSALCPGPTQSEMVILADGTSSSSTHKLQDAKEVATRAIQGLLAGRKWIRPSLGAWLIANLPRILPHGTVSGATERHYRPDTINAMAAQKTKGV
jgi:uncharacterized protein